MKFICLKLSWHKRSVPTLNTVLPLDPDHPKPSGYQKGDHKIKISQVAIAIAMHVSYIIKLQSIRSNKLVRLLLHVVKLSNNIAVNTIMLLHISHAS